MKATGAPTLEPASQRQAAEACQPKRAFHLLQCKPNYREGTVSRWAVCCGSFNSPRAGQVCVRASE